MDEQDYRQGSTECRLAWKEYSRYMRENKPVSKPKLIDFIAGWNACCHLHMAIILKNSLTP